MNYQTLKQKLTSRKFWAAVVGFVTMVLTAFNVQDMQIEQIGSIISAAAVLIAYIIGEGMVDFRSYFSMLKAYNINVPVSLHLEYDLGGAEKGKTSISIDKKNVYKAMKKDLDTVQRLWEEA